MSQEPPFEKGGLLRLFVMTKKIAEEIVDTVFHQKGREKSVGEENSLKTVKHPAVIAYAKRIAEMSGRDFDDVMANPPTMLVNYKRWIYSERD